VRLFVPEEEEDGEDREVENDSAPETTPSSTNDQERKLLDLFGKAPAGAASTEEEDDGDSGDGDAGDGGSGDGELGDDR
jgi:hypothetical protein